MTKIHFFYISDYLLGMKYYTINYQSVRNSELYKNNDNTNILIA